MMKPFFRQLLIASAIGVMSLGVQAQPDSTAPSATATPPSATKTPDQALNEYQMASDACGAKAGLAKSDCLKNARDEYERALTNAGFNGNMGGGGQGGYGGNRGATGAKINKS